MKELDGKWKGKEKIYMDGMCTQKMVCVIAWARAYLL